jgi:hypothetical protein
MAQKPQSREERLAAALRANLKRRKDAVRARPKAAGSKPSETGGTRPNTAKKPG